MTKNEESAVNAMENTPPGMDTLRDDSLCSCFDAASGCSWSSISLSSGLELALSV
jgi:hypothetical protein